MMTRLVKTLFFIGVGLLAVGLVAPSFINWNRHKSTLMAQISPYFQRKISVAGNISFQILPQPELLLENVTVANADGSMKNPLMTLKSIEAQVSLAPLLQGKIVVDTVDLVQPVFNLDVNDEGKTNFSGLLAPSDNLGAAAQAMQFNQVTITDGTLHYANFLTGTHKTFDNLTLTVSANTLLGPYSVSGNMEYQQTNAGIEIDTGVFDRTMTAPVKISFTPVENMPQISMNGTVSLQSGINLAGELSVSNGSLASLIHNPSLSALDFWGADVNLTGAMTLKMDSLDVQDINARFGHHGRLRGEISVRFPQQGLRDVRADLSAKGLIVTSGSSSGYPDVPDGYKISLDFKGDNVTWNGKRLETAHISAYSRKTDWIIKSGEITLPGKSAIDFSGSIMPRSGNAIYTKVRIMTDDLGKMVDAFAPDATSAFSMLSGANPPFRKMQMDGSVEVSPVQASFYNMRAVFGEKEKLSGVLNVARHVAKPKFTAVLHFDGWSGADFSDGFLGALMQSDADLQLTADNFSAGGLSMSGVTFNAATGANGMAIDKFSGNLADNDAFSVKGSVANLAPVSGLNVSYTLAAADALQIAKSLGVSLPPLQGKRFSIKGAVTEAQSGVYSYTAAGQADDIVLYGQTVSHPSFFMKSSSPSAVSLSLPSGKVWGGTLKGELDATAQSGAWASSFKGSVVNADLSDLQKKLGLKGFALGAGDIAFNLSSADNALQSATGDISFSAEKLKVDGFNVEHLPERLDKLKKMPDDIDRLVNEAVHQDGASVFKNAQGKFKLDHGKITIENLRAENALEKMSLTGSLDTATKSYDISGALRMTKPQDFPALTVSRSSSASDYKISGGKALQDYIAKRLPPPVVAKKLKNNAKKFISRQTKDQPIDDILDRLNDGGALQKNISATPPLPLHDPAVLPAGKSSLAVPGQASLNGILRDMQAPGVTQPDNGLPVTLTP